MSQRDAAAVAKIFTTRVLSRNATKNGILKKSLYERKEDILGTGVLGAGSEFGWLLQDALIAAKP